MLLDRETRRLLGAVAPEVARSSDSDPSYAAEDEKQSEGRARLVSLVRAEERPSYFDYQADLLGRMAEVLTSDEATLLSLPTGAGKTRTAIGAVLAARLERPGLRVCWLAPTYELVNQAFSTAIDLWRQFGAAPDMRVAMAGEPEPGTDLWLTTPQAVTARSRRRRSLGGWDAVVFDEAHQMTAPTFSKCVRDLRERAGVRSLVGLSATPGRASEREIDQLTDLFHGRLLTSAILGRHPVEELQRRGVLSQLHFRSLSSRESAGLGDVERLKVLLRACKHLAGRGRRVLVFASSVPAARVVSIVLRSRGISANWISGELGLSERSARIDGFAAGRYQVLANQRLLATGYDCPAVSDVVIQARIASPILFEQIVGRAARGPLTGGTPTGTIWQFEDHLAVHGLPQSYYRYRDYDWS